MKLLTPPIKDCRYIHKKLRKFFDDNHDLELGEPLDLTEFNRALKRLCDFFKLPKPKIEWYNGYIRVYKDRNRVVLGECGENGILRLINPAFFRLGREKWIEVFYHEFGHYVLWADAERKAKLFAERMMEKWKKRR